MKTIRIPYDTEHMELHVSEENLKAVLYAKTDEYAPRTDARKQVLSALENPIGTPRLSELTRGKTRVTIITSDHTRAVPSRITLPLLLGEIRSGNPAADITILIATGLHRAPTQEEQRRMFGDAVAECEHIVAHNAFDGEFVDLGKLPSGADCRVNKLVMESDLLVAEGFIEPHFFAGFSGGRKSILPGVCAADTVNQNHAYSAIASPYAKAGVLQQNPIHADMVCAARSAKLAFILNVALNGRKEVIGAFAGDMEAAHEAGVSFVRKLAQSPAVTGDIVITSNGGYPLDQNLYQAPKAAATAEACAGEDGVIILCAACKDGMGGTHFEKLITSGTPEEIDKALAAIPPRETIPEQWCAQIFSRILHKHALILVSNYLAPETVRKANMIPASSLDEALARAYEIKGADASVVVIPDGVAVLASEGEK